MVPQNVPPTAARQRRNLIAEQQRFLTLSFGRGSDQRVQRSAVISGVNADSEFGSTKLASARPALAAACIG